MSAHRLDSKLLIKLLTEHRSTIDKTQVFILARIDEQISLLQNGTSAVALSQRGGEHYGSVRNWIQCKAVNGDRVTWGSNDPVQLSYNLTVKLLEDLSCRIAAAAVNDFLGR